MVHKDCMLVRYTVRGAWAASSTPGGGGLECKDIYSLRGPGYG